jgi:ribose transport system ATP-binding protein
MSPEPTAFEADSAVPARLEMRHISKSFGGVRALRDVSFRAGSGQVVALCGENGAGKSTLMKILAGAIVDYEGEIVLDGRHVRFSGPRQAEDAAIRIIYQELNLVTSNSSKSPGRWRSTPRS